MRIITLDSNYAKTFENLFVDYFREIGADVQEDIIRHKLMAHIFAQQEKNIIRTRLIFSGEDCAGFSIFQIDTEESDWCKKPGWGFIREFYIVPACRKRGVGRCLAEDTESLLREMGAEQLYLTGDTGIPFWLACGWHKTGEFASNDLEILIK